MNVRLAYGFDKMRSQKTAVRCPAVEAQQQGCKASGHKEGLTSFSIKHAAINNQTSLGLTHLPPPPYRSVHNRHRTQKVKLIMYVILFIGHFAFCPASGYCTHHPRTPTDSVHRSHVCTYAHTYIVDIRTMCHILGERCMRHVERCVL